MPTASYSRSLVHWLGSTHFSVAVVLLVIVIILSAGGFGWLNRPSLQEEVAASSAKTVSIQARNVDVRDVLRSFAEQIGARLVLEGGISGKISIEANESRLEDVMDNLCTAFSCEWSISGDDSSPRLVVRASSSP